MVCVSSALAAAAAVGSVTAAAPRYVLYADQYHSTVLPNNTLTAGITHVITAFANSSYFVADSTMGDYTPFIGLTELRAMFDNGTQVCMAIGGWGDTEGFRKGAATNASRSAYAQNVAATLTRLGYDCVDVDWEYPAGNGYDYKQVPNSDLTSEIDTYPLFLSAIKSAIGDKELSVAVPGLERDMIAFTADKVPQIDAAVDFINVMTYDLMNRRDTVTKHHTDVNGSLSAIETYIARGATPAKMNLGIAFYAKYFTLASNSTCTGPTGCAIALAEAADGTDTGTSGAVTFEASSFPSTADTSNLTASTDGTCGTGTSFLCSGTATSGSCCSQYGYCGDTSAHCGSGCQSAYGTCSAADESDTSLSADDIAQSFANALANGQTDADAGAQWLIDSDTNLFWTWDTSDLITQKFSDIIEAKSLGGIMAWSLGEDSNDWGLLKTMQEGVAKLSQNQKKRRVRRY